MMWQMAKSATSDLLQLTLVEKIRKLQWYLKPEMLAALLAGGGGIGINQASKLHVWGRSLTGKLRRLFPTMIIGTYPPDCSGDT